MKVCSSDQIVTVIGSNAGKYNICQLPEIKVSRLLWPIQIFSYFGVSFSHNACNCKISHAYLSSCE